MHDKTVCIRRWKSIYQGTHASVCIPEITAIVCGDMCQWFHDGFSFLFPALDVVHVFRDRLKMSCISLVPQDHHWSRLILTCLWSHTRGHIFPMTQHTDISCYSLWNLYSPYPSSFWRYGRWYHPRVRYVCIIWIILIPINEALSDNPQYKPLPTKSHRQPIIMA